MTVGEGDYYNPEGFGYNGGGMDLKYYTKDGRSKNNGGCACYYS
jgi:hypothetical protein